MEVTISPYEIKIWNEMKLRHNHVYLLSYFMYRKMFLSFFFMRNSRRYYPMIDRSIVNALWLITLALVEENRQCSSHHIQWRINRNYILYKEHVRINLLSDTNDNNNSASSSLSEYSSSAFVYTGFWSEVAPLHHHSHPFVQQQLHVILAQI